MKKTTTTDVFYLLTVTFSITVIVLRVLVMILELFI